MRVLVVWEVIRSGGDYCDDGGAGQGDPADAQAN